EGRNANIEQQYRKARPSSGHPGIVMAGMCDRSVRVLRDDMDKTIFVKLCRTHSGTLIDMKKLD
ncbi:MAG: hypothetical protein LBH00_03495, partial [Planctomycetaceae bacterium]|nr:hypothetical protein [Planctomycetaceae bacterium]